MLRRPATLAIWFVAGGIGGTLLDQIHVRTGVLRYAHPALAGQAWWVAPQFGVAVVGILLFATAVARRSRGASGWIAFVGAAAVFVVAYAVTGLLRHDPWVVTIFLVVLWVGMVMLDRERAAVVVISVVLAVAGPVYESALTWSGSFHYTVTPLIGRVPVWLPILYLNAGVLAASAARALGARRAGVVPQDG